MKRGKSLKFVVRETDYSATAALCGQSLPLFQTLRLLLLGVLTVACGSPSYTVVDPSAERLEPPAAAEGPESLLSVLDDAREAWAAEGVVEQAPVPWVRYSDNIGGACDAPPGVLGCWRGGIFIREDLPAHMLEPVMIHELGHALRQDGRHLDCPAKPGDSLMCDGGSIDLVITERDVAFVTRAL